ncbi:The BTB (BR-C, ttk and bab)/POZ (Pox virus and Zinc finger) domain [Ceratobasidium sp. AG-Ba]|nr:The BTB (BR-C, ttk and bab)/POZ (Pox virus and Zinc finger) domain [Ceratobasidium sp. AG-Ba]
MSVINPPDFRCRSKRFFFWMDGDTFFEVEGVIFRLHKAFLTLKSEWFAALFDVSPTPKPGAKSPMLVEGLTEQQPICLSGIKRDEFEHLLGAMYDENLACSAPISKDTLVSIFRLADMWLLDEIREATLTKLHPHFSSSSPCAPIEKLQFATRYNVPEWATEAYMELATRPAPLSPIEAGQLGQDTVFALMAARESIARRRMRVAFGPENRWRCMGGEMARSRGCARQVLNAFRAALTVELGEDGCLLNAHGEETVKLDTNASFLTVWREAFVVQHTANRSKNPGLCEACARVFGSGGGPGALAWLDYDSDVEIIRNELGLP